MTCSFGAAWGTDQVVSSAVLVLAGCSRHRSAKRRRNLDGRARLKADSAANDHNIPGHDTFVFAPGRANETIMNFQNGYDKPGLSAQGFSSIAGIDHEFVGKDPLIDLDGSPEDLAAILTLGGSLSAADGLIWTPCWVSLRNRASRRNS